MQDQKKDKTYNALSDFINNELKIVLTVKNIKDGLRIVKCILKQQSTKMMNEDGK